MSLSMEVETSGVMFRAFRTVDPGTYEVSSDDTGSLITAVGNDIVLLPAPELLPVGTFGVRKGDNGAGPVIVRRGDEEPIAGWAQLTLAMCGDYCHIGNTGTEYVLVACGAALPGTSGGQHRTPLRSIYPHFYVGPWDRGAVIRYVNDIPESGNVVLPTAAQAGFVAGGYRNGFQVTILAAGLPENCFIAIHAPESSIHRKGSFILLTHPFEVVTLDFDGHEWFIVSHYIPGAEPSKP